MRYRIEWKIETLANNAVMKDGRIEAAFTRSPIRYSHWDFDINRGWPSDSWLAEASIDADNYKAAFRLFRDELNTVVPRISLICQTYIDYLQQPFLIAKDGEMVGFLRYMRKRAGTGLMFVESHVAALDRLVADRSIPNEFYYYWNDVVNAVGYIPKLLLMCSAIECLTRKGRHERDWTKVEQVLGRDLKEDLFGTKQNSDNALRNRLTHGDYLGPSYSGKNYVELIHKKVMAYFNDHVLHEPLLELGVVKPQRHFWGNVEGGGWFIKPKGPAELSLNKVLADYAENGVDPQHYEVLDAKPIEATY